jgi:hypothetical protein
VIFFFTVRGRFTNYSGYGDGALIWCFLFFVFSFTLKLIGCVEGGRWWECEMGVKGDGMKGVYMK